MDNTINNIDALIAWGNENGFPGAAERSLEVFKNQMATPPTLDEVQDFADAMLEVLKDPDTRKMFLKLGGSVAESSTGAA